MGYGWRSVFRDIVFLPCTQDTLPIRCPPAATAGICTKVLGSLRRAGAVCRKTLYAYHVELHASKYLGILLYTRLLSVAIALAIGCPPAATAGICTKVLGSLRRAGAVCRKTLYAYHVELHASKYLGILLLYARLLSAAFVKFPPRKTPLIRL